MYEAVVRIHSTAGTNTVQRRFRAQARARVELDLAAEVP